MQPIPLSQVFLSSYVSLFLFLFFVVVVFFRGFFVFVFFFWFCFVLFFVFVFCFLFLFLFCFVFFRYQSLLRRTFSINKRLENLDNGDKKHRTAIKLQHMADTTTQYMVNGSSALSDSESDYMSPGISYEMPPSCKPTDPIVP